MHTSEASAAPTTTSSSASGRNVSRSALRPVSSESMGHNRIHPVATSDANAAAIPASTPSWPSVSTPTNTPTRIPAITDALSRATADNTNADLMTVHSSGAVPATHPSLLRLRIPGCEARVRR